MFGERDDQERIDWALAAPDRKPLFPLWKARLVLLTFGAIVLACRHCAHEGGIAVKEFGRPSLGRG
jgi:hypothetical protein